MPKREKLSKVQRMTSRPTSRDATDARTVMHTKWDDVKEERSVRELLARVEFKYQLRRLGSIQPVLHLLKPTTPFSTPPGD